MQSSFHKYGKVIAVAGVLAAAAGLSLDRSPRASLSTATPDHEPPEYTETEGEEGISAHVQTPRTPSHADEASFDRLVLDSEVPVLVDFYADWCGPCQMLAPTLEELAREAPHAKIVKVDVDRNPRLAARYGVSSIPSLKVFRDGQVVAQHVGLADKEYLRALLNR